jgi:hypothetical protein
LGQLPARLTVEQAGWVLGCQPHDVPVLVSYRLLKPLGNPPPNGIKFFAAADEVVAIVSYLIGKFLRAIDQALQMRLKLLRQGMDFAAKIPVVMRCVLNAVVSLQCLGETKNCNLGRQTVIDGRRIAADCLVVIFQKFQPSGKEFGKTLL